MRGGGNAGGALLPSGWLIPAHPVLPAEECGRSAGDHAAVARKNPVNPVPRIRSTSRVSAFTLFEIVVAMSILALISGTVLSILWQAGGTAAEIRVLDRRDEELSLFLTLLRETVEGLPREGSITMVPPSEAASGFHEMRIEDAVTAFAFGEKVDAGEGTTIGLRPRTDSASGETVYDLALSRDDFGLNDEDGDGMAFNLGQDDFLDVDEQGRYWIPLLSGVDAASWRFWDGEGEEWLDEWVEEDRLPPLLEFSLDDSYRPVPLRAVFQVAGHLVDPEAAEQGAATADAGETQSSSSSVSRGGRGGGGREGDRRREGRGDRGDRGESDRGRGDRGRGGFRGRDGGGGDRPDGNGGGGPRPGGGAGSGGGR